MSNLKQAMKKLEALGNEKMRVQNTNHGATGPQFGVRRGEVRKLAKEFKGDHALGLELWQTGNIDARFLAILLLKPKQLELEELDQMVRNESFVEAADWFTNYVLKKHPRAQEKRAPWMDSDDVMAQRAGWQLTAQKIAKGQDEELDLDQLLDRIESTMAESASQAQWTMNATLVEIGIRHPNRRERAIAIGEKLGIYSDYPTSKGCISPFAPIWIREMVDRQS